MRLIEDYLKIEEFTNLLARDSKIKDKNKMFVTEINGPYKANQHINQHHIKFKLNFPNKDYLMFDMILKKEGSDYKVEMIRGTTSHESEYENILNENIHKLAIIRYFRESCGITRLKLVLDSSEIK
ncbi:TPA: hypothetical protein ACGW7M_004355 [Bacillus albus]